MTSSCNQCSPTEDSPSIEGNWSQFQAYKDFSSDIQSKISYQRIPTSGTIEIIENCNFRCLHCYQGMNKAKKNLSGEKWCSIIDELKDAGTLWLLITGGEPLMHPDFEMIYKHAIKSGMLVYLFTNGSRINDKVIQLLEEYPPFSIEITLYGASESTYNKVTQTKKSYELVLKNCKKLIDKKLPLSLKSVAIKPLIHEISTLKKFVENDLKLNFKFDTKIDPTIYGDQLHHLRPTPEETIQLELSIEDQLDLSNEVQRLKAFNEEAVKKENSNYLLYRCGAGKSSFYIDHKGFVHTCAVGRIDEENLDLNQLSFKDIWEKHFPNIVYKELKDKNANCVTCKYRSICDVCPATAKLATGSKEGLPQYVCQHTMMRKTKILDKYLN